jgi:PAS domain S-box-containing protein
MKRPDRPGTPESRPVPRPPDSALWLASVMEHAPIVLFALDPAGVFTLSEGRGLEALGLRPGAVVGRSVFDVYRDEPALLDHVRRALEGWEFSAVVHAAGRVYQTRYRPLSGPGGEPAGCIGVATDITERARSEADLAASEAALRATVARLEATLDATADGILALDSAGHIVGWNRRFVEITGVPEDVLAARDMGRLSAHVMALLRDPEGFACEALDLAQRPDAVRFGTFETRDGRVFERRSIPMRIGGETAGRVYSYRDVTERRRAEERLRTREEELRRAQRMDAMGRLAGGVAHDFNNVLTAILGHIELLIEAAGTSGEVYQNALEIRAAAQRASHLTGRLLAFGRRETPANDVVDLRALADGMQPMLRAALGSAIALELVHRDPEVLVRGDRDALEQALLNLAVNARDAMPAGGPLRVETALAELDAADAELHPPLAAGPHAVLRVRDAGTGMDEETRSRMFEPFFTTKARGQGLGLGLATVYATVAHAGGHIEVRTAPGQGTLVALWFPAVVAGEAGVASGGAPAEPPCGDETLLLAEDDDVVRALLERLLTGLGYRVVAAADATAAVAADAALARAPDLLITDIVMPGRGGLDLALELRARHPGLPVLCVSGHTREEVLLRIAAEPGMAFMQKPFTPTALAQRVRELLDARAGQG